MKRWLLVGLVLVAVLVFGVGAAAQAITLDDLIWLVSAPPINTPMPAVQVSDSGFGDRQNSYAWSMGYFKGDLYVGTGRCVDTFNIMWEQLWKAIDPEVRPPELPGVPHPPFLQDFMSAKKTSYKVTNEPTLLQWASMGQGEIWRLHDGAWSRVYQSPMVDSFLTKMDPSIVSGPYQVPMASGFRSMITFDEGWYGRTLYATSGGFSLAANQPLLYRTTNGVNWAPVVTPKGMGRESRSMAVLNGKLYIGVGGGVAGVTPAVWCSSTPTIASSWVKCMDLAAGAVPALDSTNLGIKAMAAFNNKLYVGTQNLGGFQVYRSNGGSPTSNADWTQIVRDGAGDRYNANAQTMQVFRGQLYITTLSLPFISNYDDFKGFEIIRVNPDDSWELVVGSSDPIDPPDATPREPISGIDAGFGNPMAFYGWSMEVWRDELYVGNLDTSVFLLYAPMFLDDMPPGFELPDLSEFEAVTNLTPGCDLYKTRDGVHWVPVTTTGFGMATNYGFRTMKATGDGFFLGTANPWLGCQIWKLK
jgi:hypothetical protein